MEKYISERKLALIIEVQARKKKSLKLYIVLSTVPIYPIRLDFFLHVTLDFKRKKRT